MDVTELLAWIAGNREAQIASLLDGSYQPQPVRGGANPQAGRRDAPVGHPYRWWIVWCSKAIAQTLGPVARPDVFDIELQLPSRTRAHDALRPTRNAWPTGMRSSLDLDLEKFFDRVNHDILMSPPVAAHRRQAPAAASSGASCRPSAMAERCVQRTARGHAPGRPAVASAVQSAAGRPGQGVGTPGTPLLPVTPSRLQYLCCGRRQAARSR